MRKYVHTRVYVFTRIYVYTRVYVYTRMYVYTRVYVYTSVSIYIYIYTRIFVRASRALDSLNQRIYNINHRHQPTYLILIACSNVTYGSYPKIYFEDGPSWGEALIWVEENLQDQIRHTGARSEQVSWNHCKLSLPKLARRMKRYWNAKTGLPKSCQTVPRMVPDHAQRGGRKQIRTKSAMNVTFFQPGTPWRSPKAAQNRARRASRSMQKHCSLACV